MKEFEIGGRVALVTGGAQGLGQAIAKYLALNKADVIIADLNERKGEDTTKQIESLGRKAKFYNVDVSDRAAVNTMVEDIRATIGKVDVLINSAGLNRRYWMKDISSQDFDLIMDVNLKGTFNMCQAVGNLMIDLGLRGSVINISSISSFIVNKRRAVGSYCASKSGVNMLTKAFAAEWAEYGIRVNAIAPGYFKTPLNEPWMHTEQGNEALDGVPMARFGQPEEIGPSVLYLASDASSYVTGHILVVDGGYTAW